SRERGQTGDVEEILDGKGDAGERAGLPARRERSVHGFGVAQGTLREDGGEAIERPIARADPLEGSGRHFARRHAARSYVGGDAEGVRRRHGSKTGAVSVSPTGKSPRNAPAARRPARFRVTPSRHSGGMRRPRSGAASSTYRATSDGWGDGSGVTLMPGDRPTGARHRRS